MSFANMKNYMLVDGEIMRKAKINDGRYLMADQFDKDPSYEDGFVFWEYGIAIEDMRKSPIKTFGETLGKSILGSYGFTIEFNTLIDNPVIVGDTLYDTETNVYWLCVESYNRDKIHWSGKMVKCNNFLKWQDENGEIYEYPFYDSNATQYNSGVTSNNVMTIGSAQHKILITADDNTIALDHDKRFFLDRNKKNPTVYKLTQADTTAYYYDKGLLTLMVSEHQYNPESDSIEKWICDYKDMGIGTFNILYKGKPVVRVGGKKRFSVESNSVTWNISGTNFDENYLSVAATDNYIDIACKYNETLLDGKEFTLTATVNGQTTSLLVKLTGGV